MKSTTRYIFVFLLTIVTALFLILLLSQKLQLGLVRYFDADELAYLHWAHNIFVGKRPFIDFFFYVPPGFLWFVAPLYMVAHGTSILILARVVAFIIFVLLSATGGAALILVRKPVTRAESLWIMLLTAGIFAFLPLPADKLLELRPDNLALFLAGVGLICQIRSLQSKNKTIAFWAGIFYSVSLLILPKTLPQVMVACVVALFFQTSRLSFFAGIMLPMVFFGTWILWVSHSISDIQRVLYSLTKLPLEVNKIGQLFPMQPDLFFYPNTIYYGISGWSRGLIANHAVWIVGLLYGVWRLITPWVAGKDKTDAWIELLIGGSFFAYIAAFMYGYPLRHAQYLIPIAFFVAFYAADATYSLWNVLKKNIWGKSVFVLGYVCLGLLLWGIAVEIQKPKLSWTNAEDIQVLDFALRTVPKNAYVLDLVGATIYFRDPAYGCCLPFGQYTQFLSTPLPSISDALSATNTQYVYQGRLNRVNDLDPSDKQYIQTYFHASPDNASWLIRR